MRQVFMDEVAALINMWAVDEHAVMDDYILKIYTLCIAENARKAGSTKKTISPERAAQLRSYGFKKGQNPKEKRS